MVHCPAPDGSRGGRDARGFWIDRFEVTAGDYREFLARDRALAAAGVDARPRTPWTPPGSLPATRVTLFDARAFAAWRGKRLPTSPEWEWAARGSPGFEYPWSDTFVETFGEHGRARARAADERRNVLQRALAVLGRVRPRRERLGVDGQRRRRDDLRPVHPARGFVQTARATTRWKPRRSPARARRTTSGPGPSAAGPRLPTAGRTTSGSAASADEDAVERDRGFRRALGEARGPGSRAGPASKCGEALEELVRSGGAPVRRARLAIDQRPAGEEAPRGAALAAP